MHLRFGLPLIVSILLFTFSVLDGAEAGELPRIVRIQNIRLYQAISAELRKKQIYRIGFSDRDLRKLTVLNAKDLGISDLGGLEHATNLTKLDLSGNRLTDVSLLAGLTHLRVLNLEGNGIRDISPLSRLKNLTQLNLKGNAIVDISPLVDLPALSVLNLEGNEIRETSALPVLKTRTHLNFNTLGGALRGEIVEPTYEFPVEGVRVVLLAEDGAEYTTTASYGSYEFTEIPEGRYLLSIHKKGYYDRIGKPVTIVKGGNHYLPLKIAEMESLMTSFRHLLLYILLLCGLTALVTFYFTKRAMAARSVADP